MTWWQTLIVAVAPVLITLVITTFAEGKRRKQDAALRQQDRDAQRQIQADARRASIEDHWRNERFTRMTALVDVVSGMTRLAIEAKTSIQFGDDEPDDLRNAFANAVRDEVLAFAKEKESALPQAVTQVSVISSQKFYVYSLAMTDEIRQGFKPVLDVALNGLKTRGDFVASLPVASEFADKMSLINQRLINAVREELTGDVDSFFNERGHDPYGGHAESQKRA